MLCTAASSNRRRTGVSDRREAVTAPLRLERPHHPRTRLSTYL